MARRLGLVRSPDRPGQILGHEPAGVVADVGADVEQFSEGDRVTVPFHLGDGSCQYCQRGHANICETSMPLGFLEAAPGAFAEAFPVREADFDCVTLPDAVDFTESPARLSVHDGVPRADRPGDPSPGTPSERLWRRWALGSPYRRCARGRTDCGGPPRPQTGTGSKTSARRRRSTLPRRRASPARFAQSRTSGRCGTRRAGYLGDVSQRIARWASGHPRAGRAHD